MQTSWREDEDKCTFIILSSKLSSYPDRDAEISAMIGDVNIFLNAEDNEKGCEIEIMIADKGSQGKGYGLCPGCL